MVAWLFNVEICRNLSHENFWPNMEVVECGWIPYYRGAGGGHASLGKQSIIHKIQIHFLEN